MIKRFKEPVSHEVIRNVKKYLVEGELGELVDVMRASDHPDDHYLYHVIAKKNGYYRCWTCWNESTQCLNYGHYDLPSERIAREICAEMFYRISGANVID